jgi:hypothetical protein
VQCPHCDFFGHVNKKDCKHKHCINVQVDWLTILLSVSASHTITELLKAATALWIRALFEVVASSESLPTGNMSNKRAIRSGPNNSWNYSVPQAISRRIA